jgi:glycosyltransferase involved in cell wall biosynthesis
MSVGNHIGELIMVISGFGSPIKRLRGFPRRRLRAPKPPPSPSCSRWVRHFDMPSWAEIRRCREKIAAIPRQLTISALMPAFNPKPAILEVAIRSVRTQAYPHWELCIADDASSDPAVAAVLRQCAASDRRLKVRFRDTRGNMSAASNTAMVMATGDFIALFDHEDLLPPLALYWAVESINRHPNARVLYSDEDTIDGRGRRFDPYFKSDFNHVLLLAQVMFSHLGVYRRDLVESLGGFRPRDEGAKDHDLALRCVAAVPRDEIVHIPRILHHWRAIEGGTSLATTEKPTAVSAAQRAVAEHIRLFDGDARVESAPEAPSFLRVRHSLPTPPPVTSIVTCTRDHESLLRTAIDSICDEPTYPHYEIVVLDNGSCDVATLDYLASISVRPGMTVIRDDSPFNYSRLNNTAVRHSHGKVLCLLNDDIEVLTPDWLEEMVSFAVQSDVGAVGARLWYPDGTLQHGGVIIGAGGVAGHAHPRLVKGDRGYFSRAVLQQELSAITGVCLVVRRDVYDEVGGLDEQIAVAFNDVDLCLRIRAAGYRNNWTPFAELIHHESASRGYEDNPEQIARFHREYRFMQDRWIAALEADPYYSPNLSMRIGDYTLAPPQRATPQRRAA